MSDGLSTIVYGAEGVYSEQRSRTLPAPTCVLLEATYVEPGPEAERNGHMTGEQAGVLVERTGARRLVLVHLGPWQERNEENLRRARARFARRVELASAGAVYWTLVCIKPRMVPPLPGIWLTCAQARAGAGLKEDR